MMTDAVKKKMAIVLREFFGSTNGTTKLGTGGGGTSSNAIDLDVPLLTTATNTSSSSDDKVVEIKSSFTGSSLQGNTIREMGIFGNLPTDAELALIDNSSYNFSPLEQVMLARINFAAIGNFSTSDTIEVIYTMEVE